MIFSPDMLPRVLDGTKTMTTRPVGTEPCWYDVGSTYPVQTSYGGPVVAHIRITEARYVPSAERWHDRQDGDGMPGAPRSWVQEGFDSFHALRDAYETLNGVGSFSKPAWVYRFELVIPQEEM